MIKDLVLKNRTYRRFYQDPVKEETLRELVDLARNTASATNRQPLKYILSCEPETNAKIFPLLTLPDSSEIGAGRSKGRGRPPISSFCWIRR